MTWAKLCFLHWPIPVQRLRPLIPSELEVDTFDGHAWLGVVPFEMQDVRLRFLPPLPGAHQFPELNLRTYVRPRGAADGDSGVWFFSLDAASRLTVRGARATFSLPYMDARMAMHPSPHDGWVNYRSKRAHRGAPAASFAGRYRPSGPVSLSRPGSLEWFLTERYALYSQAGFGVRRGLFGSSAGALRSALLRGDIEHQPWPLQPAEVDLERCDMFRLIGLEGPPQGQPLAHYVESITVRAFRPTAIPPA